MVVFVVYDFDNFPLRASDFHPYHIKISLIFSFSISNLIDFLYFVDTL